MTEHRAGPGTSDDGASAHDALRTVLLRMVEPIVNQIRELVPSLAGTEGGKRHQLMTAATAAAFRAYLASPSDKESELRKVDELFRHLGWGVAQADDFTVELPFTLLLGTATTTRYLTSYANAHGLPQAAAYDVITELMHFTDHLRDELMEGYALGLRNPGRAKRKLWTLLRRQDLDLADPPIDTTLDLAELDAHASLCGWTIPTECVVLATDDATIATTLARRDEVLSGTDGEWHLFLVDAQAEASLLAEIEQSGPEATSVVSWPVVLEDAHSAMGWVERTTALLDAGVIPRSAVVRCADQATQLWLHADPSLRELLCQEVLEPLLAETENSRAILSETLLTWLETRDSAPAIASRMEVHPQTIRYRWKRINDLFGVAMQEPEFLVKLTLVLKATLPIWQSGDLADVRRYREAHRAQGRDLDPVEDPLLE